MSKLIKEVSRLTTECCGRTPLIEVHANECWSLWDFCPDCLDAYSVKEIKD